MSNPDKRQQNIFIRRRAQVLFEENSILLITMDLLSLLVTHSTAKHKRDIFLKLKQPQPEPDLLIKDKSSAIVSNGLLSHHINIDPNMKK